MIHLTNNHGGMAKTNLLFGKWLPEFIERRRESLRHLNGDVPGISRLFWDRGLEPGCTTWDDTFRRMLLNRDEEASEAFIRIMMRQERCSRTDAYVMLASFEGSMYRRDDGYVHTSDASLALAMAAVEGTAVASDEAKFSFDTWIDSFVLDMSGVEYDVWFKNGQTKLWFDSAGIPATRRVLPFPDEFKSLLCQHDAPMKAYIWCIREKMDCPQCVAFCIAHNTVKLQRRSPMIHLTRRLGGLVNTNSRFDKWIPTFIERHRERLKLLYGDLTGISRLVWDRGLEPGCTTWDDTFRRMLVHGEREAYEEYWIIMIREEGLIGDEVHMALSAFQTVTYRRQDGYHHTSDASLALAKAAVEGTAMACVHSKRSFDFWIKRFIQENDNLIFDVRFPNKIQQDAWFNGFSKDNDRDTEFPDDFKSLLCELDSPLQAYIEIIEYEMECPRCVAFYIAHNTVGTRPKA